MGVMPSHMGDMCVCYKNNIDHSHRNDKAIRAEQPDQNSQILS